MKFNRVLIVGCVLFFLGVTASIFAKSGWLLYASSISILLGLYLLDGFGLLKLFQEPGQPLGKLEKIVYLLTAALLVTVVIAAVMGYFDDILTFSFAAAFALTVLLLLKRIYWDGFLELVFRRKSK